MSEFRRARRLMDQLKALGIQVERHGDRLRLRPVVALSPELTEQLRNHKSELLFLMRNDSPKTAVAAKCVRCDRRFWVDDPPESGRIRTTCGRCGRFIGFRPASL